MKPEYAPHYRDAAHRVAQHGWSEVWNMDTRIFRETLYSSSESFPFGLRRRELVLYLLFMALVAEDSK